MLSKLTTAILFLVALLGFASATDIPTQCSNKNWYVNNAIGQFCQNKKLVIPSNYAKNGKFSKYQYANVMIEGGCFPAQWVPQEYCFSQFYSICAHGDHLGQGTKRFGRGGCQIWSIGGSRN